VVLAATVGIVEVEDQVGRVDIMVATEGIIAGVEDIAGIMEAMEDIMAEEEDIAGIMGEAISTEDPASTSADTLGSPTIIPTGIILTPITTIHINRMMLPCLPPTPTRSKSLIGTNARLPRVLPLSQWLSGRVDKGGSDPFPVGKRKELR
jgi:hypothetical protein